MLVLLIAEADMPGEAHAGDRGQDDVTPREAKKAYLSRGRLLQSESELQAK